MEISKESLILTPKESLLRLRNTISKYPDLEIIDGTLCDFQKVVNRLESRHISYGLCAEQVVEFFPKELYINNINECVKLVKSSTNSGDLMYALVSSYFINNGEKIGEHKFFLDIGAMVRTHFDLTGCKKDINGKIKGAKRCLIPTTFNLQLASYDHPWDMLTDFLAERRVIAIRSKDKLWFQRRNSQPIPDEYRECDYLFYEFVENVSVENNGVGVGIGNNHPPARPNVYKINTIPNEEINRRIDCSSNLSSHYSNPQKAIAAPNEARIRNLKTLKIVPFNVSNSARISSIVRGIISSNCRFSQYCEGQEWKTHLKQCIGFCKYLLTFDKNYDDIVQYYHLTAKHPSFLNQITFRKDEILISVKNYTITIYISIDFYDWNHNLQSLPDLKYQQISRTLAQYYIDLLQKTYEYYKTNIPPKAFQDGLTEIIDYAEST